jgi:predicted MFS family arabinose efflux permease
MGALYLLLGLTQHAAFFFAPKYLQEVHGFSPAHVSLLGVAGGAVAVFANSLTGRWSDLFGRRPTTIAFLAALPLAIVSFYAAPAILLPLLWVATLFFGLGSGVLLSLYGVELFPTAYRSTAAGMRAALGTVGAVLGLSLESALYVLLGSHWAAISVLATLALAAPLAVLRELPETSGRALDEISPDH